VLARLAEVTHDPDSLISGPRVFQLWARRSDEHDFPCEEHLVTVSHQPIALTRRAQEIVVPAQCCRGGAGCAAGSYPFTEGSALRRHSQSEVTVCRPPRGASGHRSTFMRQ
jgi:hypothetical protein